MAAIQKWGYLPDMAARDHPDSPYGAEPRICGASGDQVYQYVVGPAGDSQACPGAGGTPMHAALAAHHGRGVLIAAPGETGKSTCCRRLPGDWQALCDDQALVLRAPDGGFRVHPFPTWSDHLWRDSENSWTVERAVPLSAIFFLEQASTDRAMPVGDPAEAVLSVLGAAKQVWEPYWERVSSDEKMKASSLLFHNTSEIAAAVPCFRLSATLEGEFWKEMEAVMDQTVTSPHSAGPLHRSYSALGGGQGERSAVG